MTLNCLGCKSPDQTTDSELHIKLEKHDGHRKAATRNWSGPLMSFPMEINTCTRNGPIKGVKKAGKRHRRIPSVGCIDYEGAEPKLVRSRGVRRDWSFENLSDDQPKGKRSKTTDDH